MTAHTNDRRPKCLEPAAQIRVEVYYDSETPKERLERKERQRRAGIAKYHKAIEAIKKAREQQDVDCYREREFD